MDRNLSELDEEVLELTALKTPWYMVCGEFHARYGSAGALARRLFELEHLGLLEIEAKAGSEAPPSPEQLEEHALANGCYEDLESTRDPEWSISATEAGFARIAGRLSEE